MSVCHGSWLAAWKTTRRQTNLLSGKSRQSGNILDSGGKIVQTMQVRVEILGKQQRWPRTPQEETPLTRMLTLALVLACGSHTSYDLFLYAKS